MQARRWFWLAVAVQVLVLLVMIGIHGYTLKTGEPVLLKSEPIDPWHPFMGEYVTLRYSISELAPGEVAMTGAPYRRGQTVYVTLVKGEPYWHAAAVSDTKPQAGPDQVVIRGRVEWSHDQGVFIRYGVEQFYVPEGQGPGLEERRNELSVEVVVDASGRGALRRVFLDGEEIVWR